MRERCVKLLGSDCDEKKPFPYGTFAMNISKVAEVLPLLKRIDHVGIAVSDLDSAKDFYFRTFGLHVVHEESNEEQGIREAMIAIGDSELHTVARSSFPRLCHSEISRQVRARCAANCL